VTILRRRNAVAEALARMEKTLADIGQRSGPIERLLRDLQEGALKHDREIARLTDRLVTLDGEVAQREALQALDTVVHQQEARLEAVLQRIGSVLEIHDTVRASVEGVHTAIAAGAKSQSQVRKRVTRLQGRADEHAAAIGEVAAAVRDVERGLAAVVGAAATKRDLEAQFKRLRREFREEFREVRKLRNAMGAEADPAFLKIADQVLGASRTLLGYDRLFVLWQTVRNTAHLGLAAAEVGTFRGGSAFFLASAIEFHGGREPELHVVDTFTGHPEDKISPRDPDRHRGKFTKTSADDVCGYLSKWPDVHVYPGEASAVMAGWPQRSYGLVHLDVDLYLPTLECLRYFGPLLASGGGIVLDDYRAANCPGVEEAADEYLGGTTSFHRWDMHTEQLVLVKR